MNAPAADRESGGVLVVDDQAVNLQVLAELLRRYGYRVRPAISGELAIETARLERPEIVLLDITMPGMDGYEVCSRFKSDPNLRSVPIIFLSGLDDTVVRVRGFQLGAADYVTKPFKMDELIARVRAHLELGRLRTALEESNARLEATVVERTRELAAANARLAILDGAKSDFLNLISHELRTPLTGIFGVSELLLAERTDAEAAELRGLFEDSRNRLMRLVDDAVLLTQMGVGLASGQGAETSSLDELVPAVWAEVAPVAQQRGIALPAPPAQLGRVEGRRQYLRRALGTLLETSIKMAARHSALRVSGGAVGDRLRLVIESDGRIIPESVLPRFFELMHSATPIIPGEDLGLALSVAERIISLHGGTVAVANLEPPGVRFTVELRRG